MSTIFILAEQLSHEDSEGRVYTETQCTPELGYFTSVKDAQERADAIYTARKATWDRCYAEYEKKQEAWHAKQDEATSLGFINPDFYPVFHCGYEPLPHVVEAIEPAE